MAINKRKGWIRLGVVLSLVWVLGVLIYAGIEYHTVRTNLTNTVQSPTNSSIDGDRWEIVGQKTFAISCAVKNKQISCAPRFKNLVLLAIAPVIVAWVLVILITCAATWVRTGFDSDAT